MRRLLAGIVVMAAGLGLSALWLWSDDVGLTLDNNTVDPWQVVGFVAGLVVAGVGLGLVVSAVPSGLSTPGQRIAAGVTLLFTCLGWLASVLSFSRLHDCDVDPGCGHGYGFDISRNSYNFIPDWRISMLLAAVATGVAVWGLWGYWKPNGLTPKTSRLLYWLGTAATWILWVNLTNGSSQDDALSLVLLV